MEYILIFISAIFVNNIVLSQFLGTGAVFGFTLQGESYGMLLFVLAPGAFIALGYLIAAVNKIKK